MAMPEYIVIDFDSTITRVEALDVLAGIVLHDATEKESIMLNINELTNAAMEGKLPFDQALKQRLSLLRINDTHLDILTDTLKNEISASFQRNRDFLRKHRERIIVISGGFREFILPVVAEFDIPAHQIFANTFTFDDKGHVTGFDESNLLSMPGGKVSLIRSLNLKGRVIVIGDGYTDYEIRQAGLANEFYLFTENVQRTALYDKADRVALNLDEIIERLL